MSTFCVKDMKVQSVRAPFRIVMSTEQEWKMFFVISTFSDTSVFNYLV